MKRGLTNLINKQAGSLVSTKPQRDSSRNIPEPVKERPDASETVTSTTIEKELDSPSSTALAELTNILSTLFLLCAPLPLSPLVHL